MTCALLLLALLCEPPKSAPPKPAEPQEEDTTLATKEYDFNPLQATKELQVGDFYYKKKAYKSAMMRYEEATKWNPQLADAWLKLGEAREKLKDAKGMKAAFEKYLELAPDAKEAKEVRKKLGQ